jgi:hypothetical protein
MKSKCSSPGDRFDTAGEVASYVGLTPCGTDRYKGADAGPSGAGSTIGVVAEPQFHWRPVAGKVYDAPGTDEQDEERGSDSAAGSGIAVDAGETPPDVCRCRLR